MDAPPVFTSTTPRPSVRDFLQQYWLGRMMVWWLRIDDLLNADLKSNSSGG